jgi:1-deoxy-D-xylulose-5-phosphate reductoisomerase
MKNLAILGSTGSIGKNGLNIVDEFPGKYRVTALSAHSNYKELAEQIRKYSPKYVSIGSEEGYKELKAEFGSNIEIYFGDEGLKELGKIKETDIILTAVSGSIGIESTIEAVKLGKRIALANKETLVTAGDIINDLVKKHNAEIIPVDSEHSAVFQSLKSGKSEEVKKIILTASGGPFRGKTTSELEKVTLADALNHPNWSMGKKITIDSATLVNKGLEVIEAHYLFNVDYDKIDVIVHPESIIHSMVEFCDNSVIAQLGTPDMKIPIMYSFSYPDRANSGVVEGLDLLKYGKLTFEKPDLDVFKGLKFAYEAGRRGKGMPVVFNAANEEAVAMFLNGKIRFLDIYSIIEKCMSEHRDIEELTLDKIMETDKITRDRVKGMAK